MICDSIITKANLVVDFKEKDELEVAKNDLLTFLEKVDSSLNYKVDNDRLFNTVTIYNSDFKDMEVAIVTFGVYLVDVGNYKKCENYYMMLKFSKSDSSHNYKDESMGNYFLNSLYDICTYFNEIQLKFDLQSLNINFNIELNSDEITVITPMHNSSRDFKIRDTNYSDTDNKFIRTFIVNPCENKNETQMDFTLSSTYISGARIHINDVLDWMSRYTLLHLEKEQIEKLSKSSRQKRIIKRSEFYELDFDSRGIRFNFDIVKVLFSIVTFVKE